MSTDFLTDSDLPNGSLLEKLQRRIGYQFQDEGLLLSALTHASGAEHRLSSNERLEFLGDAILQFLVSEYLYEKYPSEPEGVLTNYRAATVCTPSLGEESGRLRGFFH